MFSLIEVFEQLNKLQENKAITFGDLDYGKKTETRKMQSGGRGTGHFGTGFYFINANGNYGLNGKDYYDYNSKRPIYEIELDSYNLFKPRNNNEADNLHQSLKIINNYYDPKYNNFLNSNKYFNKEEINDEWGEITWELQDVDDDIFEEKWREEFVKFIEKHNIKYNVYPEWSFDYNIEHNRLSELEKDLERTIDNITDEVEYLNFAITRLSFIFKTTRENIIYELNKAYNSNSEDSLSTLLIKSFGYEGVDVTQLNYFDNFTYGTVIYDLKPGTFKRIVEPRK